MNAFQEAVYRHVSAKVESTPAVIEAWESYQNARRELKISIDLSTALINGANEVLERNNEKPVLFPVDRDMLLEIDAAVTAAISEAITTAFLMGLTFDAKALLLEESGD